MDLARGIRIFKLGILSLYSSFQIITQKWVALGHGHVVNGLKDLNSRSILKNQS